MHKGVLIFFLCCCFAAKADRFLILKTNKKTKTYLPQSEITFRINKTWISGRIDSIGPDFLYMQKVKIPIGKIEKVKIYRRFAYTASGGTLIAAALVIPTIDVFNKAVNNEHVFIGENTWQLSAACLAAGLFCLWISSNTYTLGEKNKLEIVEPK